MRRGLLALAVALAAVARGAAADEQHAEPPPSNAPLGPDLAAPEHDGARPPPGDGGGLAAPLEVTVRADRPGGDAASRITLGRRELELRPRLRPGDVVEAVPGLFAVQHAGGGKANQYFLRGFDADHGTDVAFFVDGVPVNLPSHAHGQGFADLHFLIPELVVGLDGYKGPYYADLGDFATAGAVNLRLAERFEESRAEWSVGQYGILRGLVIASPDLGEDWRAVAAAEVYRDDGPFQNPEKLGRYNVYLRAAHDLGASSKLSMTWMSYGSTWHGSGQIPARAVCGEGEAGAPPPSAYGAACIDRFGTVDPSEGGATQRHTASLAFTSVSHDADVSAMAYVVAYRSTLYSDFTFFAEDPVRGDEIEQSDARVVAGGDFRVRQHVHLGEIKLTTTGGAQLRHDAIDAALYHDLARERLETRVDARVGESQVGLFAEEDARIGEHVRLVCGVRGQRFDVSVDDRSAAAAGGVRAAMLALPKVMTIVTPVRELDLFADVGRGFHSNDARGVVRPVGAATLLTPAMGYEVGARVSPVREVTLSAAAFRLDLDSELVWDGDSGTTSASPSSRRQGLELDGRFRVGNWLFADVDATFTEARYRGNAGNGEAVALAPTRTLTAGVGARPTIGALTPFASARVKSIGARPATEDQSLTAEGFTVVDADAGVRWKDLEAAVDVQNLLGARWREVQFASTTRLSWEPAPVTGIHYSPGWPRTVTLRMTLYWR